MTPEKPDWQDASIAMARARLRDRIQRATSDELQAAGLRFLEEGDYGLAKYYLYKAKDRQDEERGRNIR